VGTVNHGDFKKCNCII